VDGQVYAAASALSMLARTGVIERVENIDTACKGVGPGCIVFVPSFDDPHGARLDGIGLDSSRAEVTAAAVYGIAAAVAELCEQADLGEDVLRVDGGLTNLKTLLQAQADLLQVEVVPYRGAHATAQGAAALARLALDPGAALEPEIPADTAGRPVTAKWSADQAAEYRARWREAAQR